MMNRLKKITALLLVTLMTSPLLAQNYKVTSDKNLAAPFDSYKTFAWAKQVKTSNSLAYTINDAILKSRIQDAVRHEMAARDFAMNEYKPDLLLNYRVFEEPVEITRYEGFFRDKEYWNDGEVRTGILGLLPHRNTTNPGNPGTEYFFESGTLLVQMVDTQSGEVVWQGYASGLMDGNVFDRNRDHVSKAINLIFEEFDYVRSEQ